MITTSPSHRLGDLLDAPKLQALFDSLNDAFTLPSAVVDRDGTILTATAWQDVCTGFHRVHPECEAECRESDRYLERHLDEADPAIIYRCPRGLVDAATPILVGGEHLGSVFVGQLFLEPPDLDAFRAQAARFGFDEPVYLEAVRRVPLLTQAQLDRYLAVLRRFAEILGGMALERVKEREASQAAAEKAEFSRQIVAGAQEGIVVYGPDMRLEAWNPYMEHLTGMPAGDVRRAARPSMVFPFLRRSRRGCRLRVGASRVSRAKRASSPSTLAATGRSGWVSVTPRRRCETPSATLSESSRRWATSRSGKRAGEQLRLALDRLTFHVENSPFAVVEFDQDLRITSWSGQVERTFGWVAAEVLGKRVDEFCWVHEEDADRVAAAVRGDEGGKPVDYDDHQPQPP